MPSHIGTMRLSTPRPPPSSLPRAPLPVITSTTLAPRACLARRNPNKRVVRLGLRHAVQIEPAVDGMIAARDAFLGLAGQRRQRWRRTGFGWRGRRHDRRRGSAREASAGTARPPVSAIVRLES